MSNHASHAPPEILTVVGAAILRGDACLVAQRHHDMAEPLKWEFPGGKVEPGESARGALVREIREELAVEIDVTGRLGRGRHRQEGRLIELEVFTAVIVGGEIALREHRQVGWFGVDELDELDWAAADVPILPALRRVLRAGSGDS